MIHWKLEEKNIADLIPSKKNPRRMTKAQAKALRECIETFGLIDKPIVNADNQLIGGHQRVAILKKKGYKTVECWIPDRQLDAKQLDELMIRLNKNTGEWDEDMLFNSFEADMLRDCGFSEKDLLIPEEITDAELQEENEVEKCPMCGRKKK